MTMKKQSTRQMTGDEPETKTKVEETEPHKTGFAKIRCLRDCDMPGVGMFTAGQIIEDPDKIIRIGDNPNFKKFSEEA